MTSLRASASRPIFLLLKQSSEAKTGSYFKRKSGPVCCVALRPEPGDVPIVDAMCGLCVSDLPNFYVQRFVPI